MDDTYVPLDKDLSKKIKKEIKNDKKCREVKRVSIRIKKTGAKLKYELDDNKTIVDLKALIAHSLGVPVNSFLLYPTTEGRTMCGSISDDWKMYQILIAFESNVLVYESKNKLRHKAFQDI